MQVNDLSKWIDELQAAVANLKKKADSTSKTIAGLPVFGITEPDDGQTLVYDETDNAWKNTTVQPVFDIAEPADGQTFAYDAIDEAWKNVSGAGGYTSTLLYTGTTIPSSVTLSASYDSFDALLFVVGFTYQQKNYKAPIYIPVSVMEAEQGTDVYITVCNNQNFSFYFKTTAGDTTSLTATYGTGSLFNIYGITF